MAGPAVDPTRECEIRVAVPADAHAVRSLDDAAFPPANRDAQRAEPGELESGVEAGDVRVLVLGGEVVAYAHVDSDTRRIYVAGVAVRPDLQGVGLGSVLMDHLLATLGQRRAVRPVVTVTSPRNLVMLGLATSRGFAARWVLRDYFGPGRDRFGLQLTAPGSWPVLDVRDVAAADLAVVSDLMHSGYVVREVLRHGRAALFRVVLPGAPPFLPCSPP